MGMKWQVTAILILCGSCKGSVKYVEYIPGNINLIFTVPHNGYEKPESMPTRKHGCKNRAGVCQFTGKDSCSKNNICKVATLGDAHTQEMARTVFNTFVKNTGKIPHLIINNIHRSKMDPNRVIEDAAQGHSQAVDAYNAYHDTIEKAKTALGGNPGLLIDFHGQGHKKNSTEIGYLIKKPQLNTGNFTNSELGIKSLVSRKKAKLNDFLFGKESIGALFEAAGYRAVPSPRQPSPGKDLYFRGGYTAQVHGSRDGGMVDAIQLEFPGEIRIDEGEDARTQFSTRLAKILEEFYSLNYAEYVEYTPGNINLILTVPHNGYEKPDHMPTRKHGCKNRAGVCQFPGKDSCSKNKICNVATLGDAHTQEMARTVFNTFVRNTRKTPHLIINNIHRSKMDPNRVIEDAAQGNRISIEAYNAYHDTIVKSKATFGAKPGLLIDFHGQGHEKNSTEIGYLIKKEELNAGKYESSELGIKSLIKRKNANIDEFLFGQKSLGALFESAGYRAVPSPRQPSPGTDLYYRGGYTAQVHGSRDGGVVDAIQLEFPGEIRIHGGKELRTQFSTSISKIIEDFHSTNYEAFEYVEYISGNINLIFTVPHNGYEKPDHMPTRKQGCKNRAGVCKFPGKDSCSKSNVCMVATLGDAHTQEMARTVFNTFVRNTGKTPHLIINNIHRSKMDPNRVIEDAAQGNTGAREAYNTYHDTIVKAKLKFDGKPGLLIDFHGQGHEKNTTEIGYLIKKPELNSGKFANSELGIKSLVSRKKAKLKDFIFGEKSLGALFEAAGYRAVPSPRQPSPGTDLYYRGGYTAQVHGSRDGGVVDAIQLEFPGEIRIDGGKTTRDKFSSNFAQILQEFYSKNY